MFSYRVGTNMAGGQVKFQSPNWLEDTYNGGKYLGVGMRRQVL